MKTTRLISRLIIIVLLLCKPSFAYKGETIHGKVMQVKDGDTVVVQPEEGGQFFTCRLYGIDTPEIRHGHKAGQPYGEAATKELKKLILGREVSIEIRDRDRYGREIGVIRIDGGDINLEMVEKGMAWAYIKYLKTPYVSNYIDAEKKARGNKLGLWKDNNPLPPWEFRKMQRESKWIK